MACMNSQTVDRAALVKWPSDQCNIDPTGTSHEQQNAMILLQIHDTKMSPWTLVFLGLAMNEHQIFTKKHSFSINISCL